STRVTGSAQGSAPGHGLARCAAADRSPGHRDRQPPHAVTGACALTPKGDRDFASEVDLDVERALRSFLTAETPDIGFLGEEEGSTRSEAERQWILDPIDGTVNFIRALPLCGVSLALVEAGKPVI